MDDGVKEVQRKLNAFHETEAIVEMEVHRKKRLNEIGNKFVRSRIFRDIKTKRKAAKNRERKLRKKARENGEAKEAISRTRTVENSRIEDPTAIGPEGDPEIDREEASDEFASHFSRQRQPKILITSSFKPGSRVKQLILEMLDVFPIAIYYSRKDYGLKKIVEYAIAEDFTDLVVFNQDRKEVNGMLVCHLPYGPTAQFRLRNLKLRKELVNCGEPTMHKPELVLNNFGSRLGRRIARFFVSLFPQAPQFRGRQVATFHNQRDYIFFRHHRYVFEEKEKEDRTGRVTRKLKTRLQELGPRFTLKLLSLQKETFDSKYGEYEWTPKRDMRKHKKLFNL